MLALIKIKWTFENFRFDPLNLISCPFSFKLTRNKKLKLPFSCCWHFPPKLQPGALHLAAECSTFVVSLLPSLGVFSFFAIKHPIVSWFACTKLKCRLVVQTVLQAKEKKKKRQKFRVGTNLTTFHSMQFPRINKKKCLEGKKSKINFAFAQWSN